MKTGRNEPCPCGSGKKYKRCCGHSTARDGASEPIQEAVRLFRRIAYVGEVGRARKAFCMAYTKRKRSELERIHAFQKEQSRAEGEEVQCRKGCTFCCAHFVGGTLQECEGIVYHLYTHGEALSSFLLSYREWRKAVGAHEELFKRLGASFREMATSGFRQEVAREHMTLCGRYLSLNIACPFLQRGSCTIYPVRPCGCAALYATTPPLWCDPRTPQQPRQLTVTAQHAEAGFYFGTEVPLILSNVPLMVYELLKGGYVYLAGMPGLKRIDRTALNDFEVRRMTLGMMPRR